MGVPAPDRHRLSLTPPPLIPSPQRGGKRVLDLDERSAEEQRRCGIRLLHPSRYPTHRVMAGLAPAIPVPAVIPA